MTRTTTAPDEHLRDAAIEWADQAADLATTLRDALRNGDDDMTLLRKALDQARANLTLSKVLEQLLDID
jgi:hypothetical protein